MTNPNGPPLELKQRVDQRLVVSLAIRQSIEVLQMPILELSIWLKLQVEQNPLLEWEECQSESDPDPVSEYRELNFEEQNMGLYEEMDELFQKALFPSETKTEKSLLPEELPSSPSLMRSLENQIEQELNPNEKQLAKKILELLDQKGFFSFSHEEASTLLQTDEENLRIVLKKMQGLDPIGVASANVRQFFLLQLEEAGKKDSLAYYLIEKHFDDFLHRRFFHIQNQMCISAQKLQSIIHHDLKPLRKSPFEQTENQTVFPLIEDIFLERRDDKWIITIRDEMISPLTIKQYYLEYLKGPHFEKWEKKFIRQHLASAKWLFRIVERRKNLLTKVTKKIVEKQEPYFLQETSYLQPLTIRSIAEELDMHESTIARAIQNKYLRSDLGIMPLKQFFSHGIDETNSSHKAKELLLQLVKRESKNKPLSDQQLAKELSKEGIFLARRTIAKYRKQLNIPGKNLRRLR